MSTQPENHDTPDTKNRKTSYVTLGNKPWKIVQEFDDAGLPLRAMQYKPDGQLFRDIEYVDGKPGLVHLYGDSAKPFPSMSYSFREDFERPRIISRNSDNGKIKSAEYFIEPNQLAEIKYDLGTGQIGDIIEKRQRTNFSSLDLVNEFIKTSIACAHATMPLEGVDLGLPENPACRVLSQYANGAYREVHRDGSMPGKYSRYVYKPDGSVYSFSTIDDRQVVAELRGAGDTILAKARASVDGELRHYTEYYPPMNVRGRNQKKTGPKKLEIVSYEKDGKRFFDVKKFNKSEGLEHIGPPGNNYEYLNEVPIAKWGHKITANDIVFKSKSGNLKPHIDRSQTLFDTGPVEQRMKALLDAPSFEVETQAPVAEVATETPAQTTPAEQAPWSPPEDERYEAVMREMPAKGNAPAYFQVLYCPKDGNRKAWVKKEEYRENKTLRFREEINAHGGGTITYFWRDAKGPKPVKRCEIRYHKTPFKEWNSHIMLEAVESHPVNEEDRDYIRSSALRELEVMNARHKQDIIIDLKHVGELDPAYLETIEIIQRKAAEMSRKVFFSGIAYEGLKQKMKTALGPDVEARILPAYMNMRDPASEEHAFQCFTLREDFNTKGEKVYAEEYENGKIKQLGGQGVFREYDTAKRTPKKGTAKPRVLCFDDLSAQQVGAGRG